MKTLKSEILGDLEYWQKEDIAKNQYHFNIAQNMWNADYREYIKAGNEEEGSMGRNVSLVVNYLPPRARTNGFDLGVVYSPTPRELTAKKTAQRAIEYLNNNNIPVRFHSVMD